MLVSLGLSPLSSHGNVGVAPGRRLGEGRLTLKAVEAFIDDVRVEKPVPQDLQRRATAYAHYRWASYCIHAEVANGCAMRQLLQALVDDWRLGPQVDRQTAKTSLTRVGLK